MKTLIKKGLFGLKDGWSDKGKVGGYSDDGDIIHYEMCKFCIKRLRIATHKGGSKCKYCPVCLNMFDVFLDNISLE